MLAFRGALVQMPHMGEVVILEDAALVVGAAGDVAAIGLGAECESLADAHGVPRAARRVLGPRQMLLPGLVDTHIHAPQLPFTGTGTDLPLFSWLHTYTFPTEASLRDPARARAVYSRLVGRTLSLGTTTAAYFTTIDAEPCKVLADVVEEMGQRALVGKVSMDVNAPDFYVERTDDGLAAAADVIDYVTSKRCPRLTPAVIPRFPPTCSPALLAGLGRLAAATAARVHSHISESRDEVRMTAALHLAGGGGGGGGAAGSGGDQAGATGAATGGAAGGTAGSGAEPEAAVEAGAEAGVAQEPGAGAEAEGEFDGSSDVEVFRAAGLLRRGGVFAHGTQLGGAGLAAMAAAGAAIAHCPLSNFYFGDGLLDVANALRAGVTVGLGSDIAGGYSPSMLVAARMAVANSHALKAASLSQGGSARSVAAAHSDHVLSWTDALWLATEGGARALGLEACIGALEPGRAFDAILVDAGCGAAFDAFEGDTPMQLLEKFFHLGDDRHMPEVYVQGARAWPPTHGAGSPRPSAAAAQQQH